MKKCSFDLIHTNQSCPQTHGKASKGWANPKAYLNQMINFSHRARIVNYTTEHQTRQ